MKEDTWEKESREWQQASADDIIKNMIYFFLHPDTKNIIEELEKIPKYYSRVICSEDNPMVSFKDVKQFLLTELQALKEEVVETSEPASGDASRFNYSEDWYDGYNSHCRETKEAFEKRGVK
jgi:hypothetical protein